MYYKYSDLPIDIQELVLSQISRSYLESNPLIIGVDEVGRGCLAGDVVAGAALIHSPLQSVYKDSKTLNAEKRQAQSAFIQSHELVALGEESSEYIDQVNILNATFSAMRKAIATLLRTHSIAPAQCLVLVDGSQKIRQWDLCPQVSVVKGDQRVPVIAAASIYAKHTRDQKMSQLSEKWPGYQLEKHKGYGTAEHRSAIQKLGPSPIHRKSFGGVKEWVR